MKRKTPHNPLSPRAPHYAEAAQMFLLPKKKQKPEDLGRYLETIARLAKHNALNPGESQFIADELHIKEKLMDSDNIAIFIASAFIAHGNKIRFVVVAPTRGGDFNHVYVQVFSENFKTWISIDPKQVKGYNEWPEGFMWPDDQGGHI